MNELNLSSDDLRFLNRIGEELRTPEFEAAIAELKTKADRGDAEAQDVLEIVLMAERTQEEFNAESQSMMTMAVAILKDFAPEIVALTQLDDRLLSNFAQALQGIQRDAFAHGWRARDKEDAS